MNKLFSIIPILLCFLFSCSTVIEEDISTVVPSIVLAEFDDIHQITTGDNIEK
jgi:hypothetical protein